MQELRAMTANGAPNVAGMCLLTTAPHKEKSMFTPILKDFDYQPAFHVNHARSILPIKYGLPKFADFPEASGGSGETMEK